MKKSDIICSQPFSLARTLFRTVELLSEALKRTRGHTTPDKLAETLSKPVGTLCGPYGWRWKHDAIVARPPA